MPLTLRPIPHALNLGAPELYGQGESGQGTPGTQVLEDVNMASMVGTLAQLGALATVRMTDSRAFFPDSWRIVSLDIGDFSGSNSLSRNASRTTDSLLGVSLR